MSISSSLRSADIHLEGYMRGIPPTSRLPGHGTAHKRSTCTRDAEGWSIISHRRFSLKNQEDRPRIVLSKCHAHASHHACTDRCFFSTFNKHYKGDAVTVFILKQLVGQLVYPLVHTYGCSRAYQIQRCEMTSAGSLTSYTALISHGFTYQTVIWLFPIRLFRREGSLS
ncbi:hypothetical protein BOTBODRAFT_28948 [Botryobasidium botryosum FD-172 SS1]|uniref:Uncharacterized protein n=1 Tax=Botryobasidium botryosum (strain FD-172 SS1) TaxID=930990 RepID=A0A067N334_BOTB1|nr:hypothetical protein BOTBODRAFT_28948 [Botryobasidium botryosum FD-172 SS1]